MTDPKTAHLPSRAVIAVDGDDSVSFLQGIVSQNVDGMSLGDARFGTLLTPQGKILFDFLMTRTARGFHLDCFQGHAAAAVKRLRLYKLRAKVSVDLDDTLAVYAHWGTHAPDHSFKDPRLCALGHRSIGKSGADDTPNSDHDYTAHRLALGVPQAGDDFDSEERFLLDVNYDSLNGVDYKKGCFVGQEVTSRMKRKGEIRKRTLIIEFGENTAPPGIAIMANDTTLGDVISGTGGRLGLAVIRVDRLAKAIAEKTPIFAGGHPLTICRPPYLDPLS